MAAILRDIDYTRAANFVRACQISTDPHVGRLGANGVQITAEALQILEDVRAEQVQADNDPDFDAWLETDYEEPARLDPADAFGCYVGRVLAAVMYAAIVPSDHRTVGAHGRVIDSLGHLGSGLSWPATEESRGRKAMSSGTAA